MHRDRVLLRRGYIDRCKSNGSGEYRWNRVKEKKKKRQTNQNKTAALEMVWYEMGWEKE